MAPTYRALEELKRPVRLGPPTPRRAPVNMAAVKIRLADAGVTALDAHERASARWTTVLNGFIFWYHEGVSYGTTVR